MQTTRFHALLVMITLSLSFTAASQTVTQTDVLKRAAAVEADKQKILIEKLQSLARQKGWEMVMPRPNGGIAVLTGIDELGYPIYTTTYNNIVAAATIGTNTLWPGGSLGLTLNGSSNRVKSKLAVWDGGKVRNTHVELSGRVLQKDGSASVSDHATHVAGTMTATGVNPLARGMSYGLQELWAYDFTNDNAEIMNDGSSLLVSNHSYGEISGWYYNTGVTPNRWEFRGLFGANEDYKFGYYSSKAQLWDSIAYNAPYYLIVKSSGNNRDENGPAVGQPYWRYNASNVMESAGNRPDGISSNNSYDIISSYGVAKNILTVGAVNPIPNGYSKSSDVVMSSFSSWGPTDDGRIKPDVVADGVDLLSSIGTSDNAYASYSGTSMATPNTSGSLLLLQEYFSQVHPDTFMRAATLKGLAIHTADEAGTSPGPDYQFGWGLLNIKKAATVIGNGTNNIIRENVLANGSTYSLPVVASGNGKISATICWTDPKSEDVAPASSALNNPAKKLVNDLDIVIKKGATTYRPWVLSPSFPAGAAATGDNTLDNVEKIELPDVVPGETYTIEITHKGTLARGQQAYSLIASGVGGQAICTSAPTSTAGAKIDSVSVGNIQNKNAAGCTSYSNFTNLTASLQPGQTVPLFVRLASCDATAVDKIVKVFIDANNDGDFGDAGENLATSNAINGNGNFTTNITIPTSLTTGRYTILRIVMQETNNAADVNPCGSYLRGETQDYRVLMTTPSSDVGIAGVVAPIPGSCASATQHVVVTIRNFGSDRKTAVPVSVVVKQGAATVATINDTYPDAIEAGSDVTYTLQTPFATTANTTYTITATTSLTGDQDASNNQYIATVNTAAAGSDPAGTANICGNSAVLKVNPATTTDAYTWYSSAAATLPFAGGTQVTTSNILSNYYLAKNDNKYAIGPVNKAGFPSGSYNRFSGNYMQFNTGVPLIIESARLYIGRASVSKKLQLIVGRNLTVNTNGSYSYIPEASTTLDIFATDPTPQPGAQADDPADQGAVFYLNLPVTTTGDHVLILSQATSDSATFFRNNNITTQPYPIGVPGIFTFTGNSASISNPPGDFQAFYYFFYNLKLQFAGCPTPNRVTVAPTTSTVPVITQNGSVLSTTATGSYQWYRNNVPVAGGLTSSITVTESGTYKVEVTDGNGCKLTSNEINVTVTAVPNVDPSEINLVVSPNPTVTGEFTVQLETTTRANLYISLVNTMGQKVYHRTETGFIGRFSQAVKPGKLSAGIYYLQILHDNKMYIKKVVVAQ